LLSEETDPNKLHDLKADIDNFAVYNDQQVDEFVQLYLGNADRELLDPILDVCVAAYIEDLDEDGQVDFTGKAKAFARTYGFLASILPYTNADWVGSAGRRGASLSWSFSAWPPTEPVMLIFT
jgi:type I restriction enzyme, R subunit